MIEWRYPNTIGWSGTTIINDGIRPGEQSWSGSCSLAPIQTPMGITEYR